MDLVWQNLAVLLVVSAAGGYLALVAWRSVAKKKASACGGCGTCSNPTMGPEVVTLHAPSQSAKAVAGPGSTGRNRAI